mmetsp:Transcript_53973/g.123008  ORF Transcript_53973/g.123008 Transcript_53973/m.123008 type:complete len:423 (+) Transcript_53973:67-1335(+)
MADIKPPSETGGSSAAGKRRRADREPDSAETKHLLHFLLAQLRWQHGTRVGTFEEFDAEAARHDPELGAADFAAMSPLMEEFFSRHAKGDKWVPFHAALGEHELYIFTRIWSLRYLEESERYALACGFSGSRFPALFDEAVMDPCFPAAAEACPPEGRELLDRPAHAFRRGGPVHGRFLAYRARGGKLHTSAFSPRPVPRGAVGEEYTFYIMERTRTFLEMGQALHPKFAKLCAERGVLAWETVDSELQKAKWVGPTLSKMFLVSTHLCLPRLQLLDQGVEVGIGAQEAFKLLLPGIQPAKDFSMLPDRRDILLALHAKVSAAPFLAAHEPRLAPMARWCATEARAAFAPKGVPPECFGQGLSLLAFQVNLCEWRKFRNNVDKKRTAARGMGVNVGENGAKSQKGGMGKAGAGGGREKRRRL